MSNQIEVIVEAVRQSGLSPKVKVPAGVLFGVGVVLSLASLFVGPELAELLLAAGGALVGASGITLGTGYSAKPGDVVVVPAEVDAAPEAPLDHHPV